MKTKLKLCETCYRSFVELEQIWINGKQYPLNDVEVEIVSGDECECNK